MIRTNEADLATHSSLSKKYKGSVDISIQEDQDRRGLAFYYLPDLQAVRALSDRVLLMRQGEVVEIGPNTRQAGVTLATFGYRHSPDR